MSHCLDNVLVNLSLDPAVFLSPPGRECLNLFLRVQLFNHEKRCKGAFSIAV